MAPAEGLHRGDGAGMPGGSLSPGRAAAGNQSWGHLQALLAKCRVVQGPSVGAQEPNWALINPVLWLRAPARLPVSEPLSPPLDTGCEGMLGAWCEGMLGTASTLLVQDPTQQFHNCFQKGPGGLSKSAKLQSNRGGSLGGFILIDFVRSCCILLQ